MAQLAIKKKNIFNFPFHEVEYWRHNLGLRTLAYTTTLIPRPTHDNNKNTYIKGKI